MSLNLLSQHSKRCSWILVLFSLTASANSTLTFVKDRGEIQFKAIGRPSAIRISGKSPICEGTFQVRNKQVTGEAHLDLKHFDTGIAMRNSHLLETYLEVAKYPDAKLKLDSLVLTHPLGPEGKVQKEQGPFRGTLTLHGKEHPVQGTFEVKQDEGLFKLTADFGLKIEDFQIKTPTFAGITVASDVEIHLEGVLKSE